MVMYMAYYRYLDKERHTLHKTKAEAESDIARAAIQDGLIHSLDHLQRLGALGATFKIVTMLAPIRQGEVPYMFAGLGYFQQCECPNCGYDDDMEYGSYNYEAGVVWQDIECPECGVKYSDVYTYAGRETAD